MPPVYLNHLLVFVDIETYRAIADSDVLKQQFAWSEERTTHDEATGMSWTGCYFYGRHTYFEFMNPESTSWVSRDGLAFGVEQEGGSKAIEHALRTNAFPQVRRYSRSRKYEGRDIPWFWTVEIPRSDTHRLMTWVMEYHLDFLSHWSPESSPATTGIKRAQILTRYRSRLGETPSATRLFQDITSVTLSLPRTEAALLDHELSAYGYKKTVSEDQIEYAGPDIALIIQCREAHPVGIRSFTMKVEPVSETVTYSFGTQCQLTVSDHGKATWRL